MGTKKSQPPTAPAASDWRAEAEARGRAAFEAAVTEPQPTPEPLAWLRDYQRATSPI